ncbi:nucleoside hydrolase [Halobaculum sp. MBLA0143]|uniref:nucleoside hydrolase n=1 Tax=Halobaculum sp. MBLA0143 TaxID=3079933 RepID=UPI003523E8C6
MAGTRDRPTADPVPTVVDTDTASDDAQALLYALQTDRLDVRAVTVVAGNVDFDAQLNNAAHTLSLVDADVPVAAGARRPLAKSWEHAAGVHGETGLGDVDHDTTASPTGEYGPETILRLSREHAGELAVVAIGPATNLAEAWRRDPSVAERLAGVWLMGGAIHHAGNVTPAAEYNFWADPDAARLVCAELPVTLVDWGVTLRDGALSAATLDRIAAADTELADFFTAATATARERSRTTPGPERVAQPDALAAAVAAHPELVAETATGAVRVDDREGLTRGHSVFDSAPDAPEANDASDAAGENDTHTPTRVVRAVDPTAFRERLGGLLLARDPDRRRPVAPETTEE